MQSYICFDILIEFHFHFAIGKQWYYGFLRRHQELTLRKPSPLGQQRAAVTTDQMQRWYQELLQYLTDTGKLDVLSSPERILNCDESGFPLCTTSGRVLAERGKKNVYQRVTNSRQQITVLACMSASGMYLPPYIIYPGKRIRNVDIEDFPEALYGTSDSGWMTGDLFYDFLKVVSGKMEDANIQHPVLLLVDGHASHVTLRAAQFCEEKDIILYSLYPHASHIHQPCDLALFGPMKQVWKEEVHKWQLEHLGESFAKKSFPTVFKKTWQKTAIPENAIKGFQKAGIYPFNPAAIDLTRLVTHLATTSQQSLWPPPTSSRQSLWPPPASSRQSLWPPPASSHSGHHQPAVPLATTSQQSLWPPPASSQQSLWPPPASSRQSLWPPPASSPSGHHQPAAGSPSGHHQPAAGSPSGHHQPAVSSPSGHHQPAVPLATTSQQSAVPLATTSQQSLWPPPASSPSGHHQPAAGSPSGHHQPAAGSPSGHHQPAAGSPSGHHQPAVSSPSGHHQPAVSSPSGHHQPAAGSPSGHHQPAANFRSSGHHQPADCHIIFYETVSTKKEPDIQIKEAMHVSRFTKCNLWARCNPYLK